VLHLTCMERRAELPDDQSLHALPALQTLTRSAFTDSGLTPRQEQAGIHHASCPPCCAACPELRRCDSWANAADPHSQLDQGPPCSTWQAVGNLLRVRTLVLQHIAKQDEEKTTDFLCAGPLLPVLSLAACHCANCADAPVSMLGSLLAVIWHRWDRCQHGALFEGGRHTRAALVHRVLQCTRRYAASKGDNAKVRQMLRQGFAVDSCDYDGRTALILAAAKGNEDVIHSLLAAGCDPQVCSDAASLLLDATQSLTS
jgi:Ankyrin repeats (3 copies)